MVSDMMDPLSVFPVEVAIKILENIELEELLLSTRFTSRTWNHILFGQLSHLMVTSYRLRLDLGGRRFDLPLKFRNRDGTLDVWASEKLDVRAFSGKEGACLPISAGIVNRSVATLDRVQYSNPVTNTGLLDTIRLDLKVESFLEDHPTTRPESGSDSVDEKADAQMATVQSPVTRVSLSIRPDELTKWIVLCRLAQGYQTPAEARALNHPATKLNGVVGPYRGFKNSAGIWCVPHTNKVSA
ncbi:protein of unknown function [Taphrina deformans PYCC 5710]|uniref:F-box domain-containing protein n=1 Tax=Taphrina deformans (strain PYCC 5710 / ATCC 11124 / CBS 356.35 / IMI 108563 / JCM 9778 / NBRC 8474) TaxID=1097556 RepID=R4X903_TAPDE|nr:protein of unknown function [Taphrina deformans PYCC 5710]|eukprot:CCG82123.1 protein of unknown function [Taphrina deformans PYCC 5710]